MPPIYPDWLASSDQSALLPVPGERWRLFWVGQLQVAGFLICSIIGLAIVPAGRAIVLAPSLSAEIARNGIDKARLVARSGVGQYSFLTGDHTMRDQGGEFSSLFW